MKFLKFYWFAIAATVIIWGATGIFAGAEALFTVMILTLLETTFSADNAVMNSRVLGTLSPKWRNIFMTLGILIAVFVVRFFIPIFMVMLSARLGFSDVLNLAFQHPTEYEHILTASEPLINAFGGTFLVMIALSYFVDETKTVHFVAPLERRLSRLGRFKRLSLLVMLLVAVVLYVTTPDHTAVLLAAIAAIVMYVGLHLLNNHFEHNNTASIATAAPKVGLAAAAGFLYLEVLDASFSLDGVIGAFAITTSVVLIMAGLGAGAVWVRAMTVHLVKTNALVNYRFLEHGAHWAIGFLGAIMLAKLYGVQPPSWVVGTLGLVVIALALLWSRARPQSKSE